MLSSWPAGGRESSCAGVGKAGKCCLNPGLLEGIDSNLGLHGRCEVAPKLGVLVGAGRGEGLGRPVGTWREGLISLPGFELSQEWDTARRAFREGA